MRGCTREAARYSRKFEALAQFLRLRGGRRLCACAKRLLSDHCKPELDFKKSELCGLGGSDTKLCFPWQLLRVSKICLRYSCSDRHSQLYIEFVNSPSHPVTTASGGGGIGAWIVIVCEGRESVGSAASA